MPEHPQIRQGQVYWLDDCPALDDIQLKSRPVVVVILPPKGAGPDAMAIVVAASTTIRPSESDLVKLPNKQENPNTTSGLPRPCWAVPRWWLPVPMARFGQPVGYISGRPLRAILDALAKRMSEGGGT